MKKQQFNQNKCQAEEQIRQEEFTKQQTETTSQQLSALNPLDYLRLLWWILVMPQQLIDYREKFGEKDDRRVGKWLISTLIWLPLLMASLALGLEWLPHSDYAWLPETYLWISVGLVGCWLLVGRFGPSNEGIMIMIPLVVFIVFGVAISTANVLVIFVVLFVANIMTDIVDEFMMEGRDDSIASNMVSFIIMVSVAIIVAFVVGSMKGIAIGFLSFLLLVVMKFFFLILVVENIVKKSVETNIPFWLARISLERNISFWLLIRLVFLLLTAAHLFLIVYCFLGGWRLFV
jgi:hypothetical protein